jgi:hypothetical protein
VLTVEAVNIGGDNFNAKYAVEVRLNGKLVWKGEVRGHDRHSGWPFLLDAIADAARADENAKTVPWEEPE